MKEAVNHPDHYNQGGIEVIDAIEAWQLDFCTGNAVKYIARAGKKDPAKVVEDLKKAVWYLNHKIGKMGGQIPVKNENGVDNSCERVKLQQDIDHYCQITSCIACKVSDKACMQMDTLSEVRLKQILKLLKEVNGDA